MKKHLSIILLILFAAITLAACSDRKSQGPSEEFYRAMREAERRNDSIEAAQKAQHEEHIRQMARDIVKSGSNGRNYKEPTDGKQMYEDAMVGFDRYEDIDDDDDMRGFMEENDW